jgi:uncharacterized protein YcaQ
MRSVTLEHLRRHAVARTFFPSTTLERAIRKLGFVQADPIRAPARAQDLTLRHRVRDYRAGDLERRYPKLAVEEDFLVNYGFLPRATLALIHPRVARRWDAAKRRKADEVLAFIREHGPSHPREVHATFDHGRTLSYWGGTTNATTQLLDGMHYRGLLRVARRDAGVRVYEAVEHGGDSRAPGHKAAELLSLVIRKYGPLPSRSLGQLVSHLGRGGAPQLAPQLRHALAAARKEFPQAQIDGTVWYWPEGENPAQARWSMDERVRLLAPFDPLVWDRLRFELLWGWSYRFEAYTPAAKRKLGYYALPLLWREQVIGWANLSVREGLLAPQFGFVKGAPPRDRAFGRELDDELQRLQGFLGLS